MTRSKAVLVFVLALSSLVVIYACALGGRWLDCALAVVCFLSASGWLRELI